MAPQIHTQSMISKHVHIPFVSKLSLGTETHYVHRIRLKYVTITCHVVILPVTGYTLLLIQHDYATVHRPYLTLLVLVRQLLYVFNQAVNFLNKEFLRSSDYMKYRMTQNEHYNF